MGMNQKKSGKRLVALCLGLGILGTGASPVPTLSIAPSSSVSGAPTFDSAKSAVPEPSIGPSLTPANAKTLLKEFQRAQNSELKALEHRHKFELKELKASQSVRLKEWEKKEQEVRHKYFAEHSKGPERRAYIQDFIKRREAFRKMLAEEKIQRTKDQEARYSAIRQDQAARIKDFKKALEDGQNPGQHLWPNPGH